MARAKSSAPDAGAARRTRVWRNVTPTFVWKALHRRGAAGRERRHCHPRFHLCRGHRARPDGLRRTRRARRGLQSRLRASKRRSSISPTLINELTGNPTPIALAPARDWDRSGRRFGDPAQGARGSSALPPKHRCATGSRRRSRGPAPTATRSDAACCSTSASCRDCAPPSNEAFSRPQRRRGAAAIRQGGGDIAGAGGARRS